MSGIKGIKIKGKWKNKKGFYFSLDAFLASALLIGSLLLISYNVSVNEQETQHMTFITRDILNSLSNIKIEDLYLKNISFILDEYNNNNITDLNKTILDQIGNYWALNKTSKAENLLDISLNDSLPQDINFEIVIRNETLFIKNTTSQRTNPDIFASSRMISGIEQGKPLQGATSSGYLKRIRNKRYYSFIYFGGFVGQGNITVFIDDFPSDVNSSRITNITMEMDIKDDFELYINNNQCNSTFYPSSGDMAPDKWDITACKDYINKGRNNFSIIFSGEINQSYIAGGYIKLAYRTDQLQSNESYGREKYDFPDIEGTINLYDSFYIPGNLKQMSAYLHYFANTSSLNNTNISLYFTIGDIPVFIDYNVSYEENITLNNTNISSYLDYAKLSQNTVPLRLGTGNLSFTVGNATGNSDVVLITDLSGSMMWRVGYADSTNGVVRGCNDPNLYNDDTRRISLAKCLDKEFIDIVLNTSGNRVALVDFSSNSDYESLTADSTYLQARVDEYSNNPSGGTCIACAINRAYNVLNSESSSNRNKYIVVMTDGITGYCAGCGSWWWWFCNSCDEEGTEVSGQYSDCGGGSSDCSGTNCDGAMQNANYSSCRAHNDLNATVHSIGFGPVDDCINANTTLQNIADCGNGSYFASSNASELQDIYKNLASSVISIEYYEQVVNIEGQMIKSRLYGDSHININYTPVIDEPRANEIEIKIQEPLNNCNSTIDLPQGLRFIDSHVASYSGSHWTDLVGVDNNYNFNLSEYSLDYGVLGDPFIVRITGLSSGNNIIIVETGDSPYNRTNCSENNSLIFTAMVNSSITRTGVYEYYDGCIWNVEFEYGNYQNLSIPETASDTCYYNSSCFTRSCSFQNRNDTYDVAVFEILSQIDFDKDGRVDLNLEEEDLEIVITMVQGVPYLWGPVQVKAKTWK